MLRFIKNTAFIVTILCLLSNLLLLSSSAKNAASKEEPCLKHNNGIGNNHDIFVELPTNSKTLADSQNQIFSIRIDPGNPGQMKKFKGELADSGYNVEEIEFVIAQIWDAEIKVKEGNLTCDRDSTIKRDYTIVFAD